MGARLKDVASSSGVSISTVSRVLRGDGSRPVDPATSERIWAAARDLGYRPNLTARALALGQVSASKPLREIGVVIGRKTIRFSDPFFSRVIEGIDAETVANRWRLRFIHTMRDLDEGGLWHEVVRPEVIGGLIGVALSADALQRLSTTDVPLIVAVEASHAAAGMDVVQCDKEGAIAQVMAHLWELGHRRVAFLGPTLEERCRRFRAWLALAGERSTMIVDTDDVWDMEAGYTGMRRLLNEPREGLPTAVVAACDSLAVGALRAAREAGITTQRDITVVGFDDTMGAFTSPTLTTVTVEREQLGRLAVRRLIERQLHPDEPPIRLIEATHLVVRESSGAPRPDQKLASAEPPGSRRKPAGRDAPWPDAPPQGIVR